ncbi:MAG: Maf-like protein [Gammaproteobacteria bacterium]|nr:Maf-like protein [Gammaproteobacteria bacterium]
MMNTDTPQIILASASPRRGELLQQIGIAYEALPVDIDESMQGNEDPEQHVCRLALEKARAGAEKSRTRLPVLGSDTIVLLDGRVLGKPGDKQDAVAMLSSLSGREHQVLSAVAMVQGDKSQCLLSRSKVRFSSLSSGDIEAYWATGEPADKAGAYGIQGLAAQFIERLDGSYSGVMGLPLFETSQLLKEFGVKIAGHE